LSSCVSISAVSLLMRSCAPMRSLRYDLNSGALGWFKQKYIALPVTSNASSIVFVYFRAFSRSVVIVLLVIRLVFVIEW